MSRYYDVDASVEAFRKACSEAVIPADAPIPSVIHSRNATISHELLRMMLSERNLGSSYENIIVAVASIMSEFLTNFVAPFPLEKKVYACNLFMDSIGTMVSEDLNGEGENLKGPPAKLVSEKGGHA
jgi:hypothetical protein